MVPVSILSVLILLTPVDAAPPSGHYYPHITTTPGTTTAYRGVNRTYSINITGGNVSTGNIAWNYHVFWFFGDGNYSNGSLGDQAQAVAPPSGCVLKSNCTATTMATMYHIYQRTGSYDVSVTVYDASFDYTLATFVVNVRVPILSLSLPCFTVPGRTNTTVGGNIEYWAQAVYANNNTPFPDMTYQYDWGDNSRTLGVWYGGCFGGVYPGFAQHSWKYPGSYIVTVKAWDPFGDIVTRAWPVNISNVAPLFETNSVNNIVFLPNAGTTWTPVQGYACVSDTALPNLNNLTLIWNFGDSAQMQVVPAQGPNCWYYAYGIYNTIPNSFNVSITHVYTRTGTFRWGVTVDDAYGNFVVGTPKAHNITVYTNGTANRTSTLPRTIGSSLTLNAANLTNLAFATPAFNYTWTGALGTSYGPQAPVNSFVPGLQSEALSVTNSTTHAIIVANTQNLQWSQPKPTAGVYSVAVEPVNPLFTILSGQTYYQSITITAYLQGVQIWAGVMTTGQTSLPISLPAAIPLGSVCYLAISYAPLSGYNGAHVVAQLQLAFNSNTSHPVLVPHTFINGNPSTYVYSIDIMLEARGQPVYLQTQLFSPAATLLDVNWSWGDGSANGTYTHAAGPATSPTLRTVQMVHTWAAGRTFSWTTKIFDGLTSQIRKYQITEVANPTVNDTAPTVSLSATVTQQDYPQPFTVSPAQSSPNVHGAGKVLWTFGDGAPGNGTTLTHNYRIAGSFVVVAQSYSPNGTSSVSWAWVTVKAPYPVATFTFSPSVTQQFGPVQVNANRSLADAYGSTGLSYVWFWGDGSMSGGAGTLGAVQSYDYASGIQGRVPIKLVVISMEGRSATYTQNVTVNPVSLSATLNPITWTAGEFVPLAPVFSSLPPLALPFVNATWQWNDGPTLPLPAKLWDGSKWGVNFGHPYIVPGVYTVHLNLTSLVGGAPVFLSAPVTLIDPAPSVYAQYHGGMVTGENHTSTFTVTVGGSWADSNAQGGSQWKFVFAWGDGPSTTTVMSSTPTASATHIYLTSGQVVMNYTVTTPWSAAYRTGPVTAHNTLNLIPDWDGDGLPNVYENTVTHTSPVYPLTVGPPNDQGATGYGLTDFMAANLNLGTLSNLSNDPDGDGLSSMQEITASTTGFWSNPLDTNTAGDGMSDGAHFFTSLFPASQTLTLPSGGGSVTLWMPNVSYGGPAPAFNSTKLSVEFNTPNPSYLSYLGLTLTAADGMSATLSSPTIPVANSGVYNYAIYNQTPTGGPSTNYVFRLNDFEQFGNWSLTISDPYGVTGTVSAAELSFSYYTDPARADPYFQGLLAGHTLTTALYNCSAPSNEYYEVYSPVTMNFHPQYFWPWTETYYKLSVVQGVPYVEGTNAAIGAANLASGRCPTGVLNNNLVADTASYLGDADFGIAPWNAHAAGDPSLTNGMKALGATNYTLTAGLYQSNSTGLMVQAPTHANYATDPLEQKSGNPDYQLPLNPTALSSSGAGVPDSVALDPLHILGLEVTISSATDPSCVPISQTIGTLATVWYMASVAVVGGLSAGSPAPSVFTPTVQGTGGSLCGTGWMNLDPGEVGLSSSFGDTYLLPVNNSASTWQIELDLWETATMTAEGSHNTTLLSGSMSSLGVVSTNPSIDWTVSAQLVYLQRVPVVLENTTGELVNLPGYGYRFVGSSTSFDAVYVQMNSAAPPADYSTGLNVILASQADVASSSFNNSLVNNPGGGLPTNLTCLGSASVTTPSSTGSSSAGINQTWAVTLDSTNQACGTTLLQQLQGKNATYVVVGQYNVLGADQVDRLGLSPSVLEAIPIAVPANAQSPTGSAPQTWGTIFWNALNQDVHFVALTIYNALRGAVEALGNFIGSVAQFVAQVFEQALVGIFNAVVGAVQAIAHAVEQLWDWILQGIIAIFNAAMQLLVAPLVSLYTNAGKAASQDEISYLADSGVLTSSYGTEIGYFYSSGAPPQLTMPSVQTDWNNWDTSLLAIGGSIIVGVAAANIIADTMSEGSVKIAEAVTERLAEKAIADELQNDLKAAVLAVTSATVWGLTSAVTSGNAPQIKSYVASLGLGAKAANLIVSWANTLGDFGTWAMVRSSSYAGAFLFSLILDFASSVVSSIALTIEQAVAGDPGAFFLAILGLVLAGISASYQVSLSFNALGEFLFPMGPALIVTSAFSLSDAMWTAYDADTHGIG
ncbi:MAG: hypothetical protein L3K07_06960 [Thermoplasmata archaeon]|nr:hypothetical protein [Thermoplasmata archaeon]